MYLNGPVDIVLKVVFELAQLQFQPVKGRPVYYDPLNHEDCKAASYGGFATDLASHVGSGRRSSLPPLPPQHSHQQLPPFYSNRQLLNAYSDINVTSTGSHYNSRAASGIAGGWGRASHDVTHDMTSHWSQSAADLSFSSQSDQSYDLSRPSITTRRGSTHTSSIGNEWRGNILNTLTEVKLYSYNLNI